MNDPNQKPEGDDIFIRDEIEFLVPLKMRSQVLKLLKENFKVTSKLVIEEKIKEE